MDHANFDECCYNAQRFANNCDLQQPRESSPTKIETMVESRDLDAIGEAIFQKMKQETRPTELSNPYLVRHYSCKICGENHLANKCPLAHLLKWCGICAQMTDHDTRDCYYHSLRV